MVSLYDAHLTALVTACGAESVFDRTIMVPIFGECYIDDLLDLRAYQALADGHRWLRTGDPKHFRRLIRSQYFGVLRDCVRAILHSSDLHLSASTASLFTALAIGEHDDIVWNARHIVACWDDDAAMIADYGGAATSTTMPLALSLALTVIDDPDIRTQCVALIETLEISPPYLGAMRRWDDENIDDIVAGIVDFRSTLTNTPGFHYEAIDGAICWELIAISALRKRAGLAPIAPNLRHYQSALNSMCWQSAITPTQHQLRDAIFHSSTDLSHSFTGI
ncbi:MAG: hypothetical protein Q4D85_11395 [Corynebacterium sp.]|uniref:hypothetical protein n=1 Tax=Corynebacterium sp. TaxID=1720 RepID=UPI0026DB8E23|nr:hypothetical protein [Corynebacterium sp.]MDO5099339.1 hypothetical protein [Corynebacterium sp.]